MPLPISNGLRTTGRFIKQYIIPFATGFGRLVSSCGRAMFSMPKFVQYVTNDDKSPYETPITITAGLVALVMNLTIRLPAMYLHNAMDDSTNRPDAANNQTPLNRKSYSLYLAIYGILILSNGFAGLGAYLGAITLIERLLNKTEEELYHNETLAWTVQILSFYFALSNVFANVARPFKSAKRNAYNFALALQEGSMPSDKYVAYTIGITFFGIACQPFQGYFSTSNAIKRIHFLTEDNKKLDKISKIVGGISACTLTIYQIFTQPPSVYYKLKYRDRHVAVDNKYRCDTPLTWLVKFFGIGDASTTSTDTFVSITHSTNDTLGIDLKEPWLIAAASVPSLSAGIMQYTFGVLENFEEVKKDFYLYKGINTYREIQPLLVADLEAGRASINATDNNTRSLVSQIGLFSPSNRSSRSTVEEHKPSEPIPISLDHEHDQFNFSYSL